jgi:hypothetical protein
LAIINKCLITVFQNKTTALEQTKPSHCTAVHRFVGSLREQLCAEYNIRFSNSHDFKLSKDNYFLSGGDILPCAGFFIAPSRRCDGFPQVAALRRGIATTSRKLRRSVAALRRLPASCGAPSRRCDDFPQVAALRRDVAIMSRIAITLKTL